MWVKVAFLDLKKKLKIKNKIQVAFNEGMNEWIKKAPGQLTKYNIGKIKHGQNCKVWKRIINQ